MLSVPRPVWLLTPTAWLITHKHSVCACLLCYFCLWQCNPRHTQVSKRRGAVPGVAAAAAAAVSGSTNWLILRGRLPSSHPSACMLLPHCAWGSWRWQLPGVNFFTLYSLASCKIAMFKNSSQNKSKVLEDMRLVDTL